MRHFQRPPSRVSPICSSPHRPHSCARKDGARRGGLPGPCLGGKAFPAPDRRRRRTTGVEIRGQGGGNAAHTISNDQIEKSSPSQVILSRAGLVHSGAKNHDASIST
ncbi:hypothetical protein B0H11DRAFT_2272498 [Mycena galericulata]|nr:hypothetical protein B0H11DRAFT_2272498 [Mycena galericulata]